jgi:hypothetical protein
VQQSLDLIQQVRHRRFIAGRDVKRILELTGLVVHMARIKLKAVTSRAVTDEDPRIREPGSRY